MTAAFCSTVNARPLLPSWWARDFASPAGVPLGSAPLALPEEAMAGYGGARNALGGGGCVVMR